VSCPDEETLARLVEGELPDALRAELVAHVEECEACLGVVASVAQAPPSR
jgi:anti-sigma factor RsiW